MPLVFSEGTHVTDHPVFFVRLFGLASVDNLEVRFRYRQDQVGGHKGYVGLLDSQVKSRGGAGLGIRNK